MDLVINGNMNKKLLQKTSRSYLIYAVVILIFSAPIFYYLTEKLYLDDADEALLLNKMEFLQYSLAKLKKSDIPTWNKFNRENKIIESDVNRKDTLFYKNYYDTLLEENEPYRELNFPIVIEGIPYTYSSKINLVENEDLITNIAILFLIMLLLLLGGLLLITKRISNTIWKPFYETLKKIEQFEIDKSENFRLANTEIDEFNRLNQSIKNLVEKNTSIYMNQREFIENAAHELQTPLAIFQAKIDTLIQIPGYSSVQYEMLNGLNESVARLHHINKNLLLLSKLEHNSYQDKQSVLLNDLLLQHFDFFEEQASTKHIKISLKIVEQVEVISNPILAEILMNNLMQNAIRHNIENGIINVVLSQKAIVFSNTGKLASLKVEKIFSRFSKQTSSDQGNGLGLAIVKKIASINKWHMYYSFSDHIHSFTVHF
jgi:signal transduction histidine kinase